MSLLAGTGCSLVLSTDGYTSTCADLPTPIGYDASQLVFEDSFCDAELDTAKWVPYIKEYTNNGQLVPPLSGPNANELELQYWSPSQIAVHDALTITAIPDTVKMQQGYSVKAGVISSANARTFSQGGPTHRTFVQVRMRTPSRDGMWAQVSLASPTSTTLAVFGTGFIGVAQGTPVENINTGLSGSDMTFYTGTDLSKEYSDVGMELVWGQSVTWTWNPVGGEPRQIHEIIGASGIPNVGDEKAVWIALRVLNAQASAWHTVWSGDTDTFQVRAIRVYER